MCSGEEKVCTDAFSRPIQPAFGDLYEIRSQSNEIFVNAATVNDVEVIDALTSSQLRTAPNSGVV